MGAAAADAFLTQGRQVVANLDASATGGHEVAIVDMASLKAIATLGPIDYLDGLAYSPATKRVFVSDEHGEGDAIIDTTTNKLLPENLNGGGSQSHHFLAEVDAWFISSLAGIHQAPNSIAYQKVIIAPAVVSELSQVSGAYATPLGTIQSRWHKSGAHGLSMEVELPAGTSGEVHVPISSGETMKSASDVGTSSRTPNCE